MPKVAKIIGSGVFPMDMLRYDRAYPVSESDSVTISATFFNKTGYYEVLVATSLPKFTTDRWQSFGVRLVPVK